MTSTIITDSKDAFPNSSISDSETNPSGLQIVDYAVAVQQEDEHTHDPWGKALRRVIKSIVTIRVNVLRTFDTHEAGVYEGSGFVVDRKNGLILSNRHIVTQAPITATAIFANYEEINVKQDYVDPVHDFGFFRYDPAKVKFADVEEIELYPEGAKVGLDIKVCGNNAGEKLSILGGTLARIDREPPCYTGSYNDFNINYFQAASGTAGGSSGSPVLDIQGRAIALHAGGDDNASSSFFLPLEPIVRALKYIQSNKPIPRGTIQTIFLHSSYDELKRLGFPELAEKESRERTPGGTGLLTVSKVLPGGPGYNSGIEVGDVLVECYQETFEKRFINEFHALWEIIDGNIGKEITITMYRGEERKEIPVVVQDLHSITPTAFLEVCDGIFHSLSYQLAITHHMPCRGIYAPYTGQFRWENQSGDMLITRLASEPVNSVEDFNQITLSLPDRARVGFRYLTLGGHSEQSGLVEIDHHFFGSALYSRGNTWKRTLLTPSHAVEPDGLARRLTFDIQESGDEMLRNILVVIQCRVPYSTDVSLHLLLGND